MNHRTQLYISIVALVIGVVAFSQAAQAQVPGLDEAVPLTKPVLEVSKTADVSTTTPGSIVTYTVTVKNTGDAAATGLKLADILPVGFTVTTSGKNTYDYTFLGTLEPGQTVLTSYSAKVAKDITANGNYVNVASVSASNHDPVTVRSTVTVNAPVVKGEQTPKQPTTTETEEEQGTVLGAADELPATGVGQLDVFLALLGSGLISAGIIGIRRTKKSALRRS